MAATRPLLVLAVLALLVPGLDRAAAAEVKLRASHQWPGGTGDLRDEMVQIIAREANQSGLEMEVQVFPGQSLFKARDQWSALTRGQLDISAFPLAYAGGRHPEFNLTLMPALVKNHDHARRLNQSDFMARIKGIMEEAGVLVLADTWLAGGFAAKETCIRAPEDVEGLVMRAAGKAFEEMLAAANASIASMPSSEIYTAMQTGVLDAANTSSESFVSFRLYEQVGCLTPPGEHALWFMYEPILMSRESYMALSPEQQQALIDAGKKAEAFADQAAREADQNLVETFEKNGVEIATMTEEQFKKWRDVAMESSYKSFVESVEDGEELLSLALSVE